MVFLIQFLFLVCSFTKDSDSFMVTPPYLSIFLTTLKYFSLLCVVSVFLEMLFSVLCLGDSHILQYLIVILGLSLSFKDGALTICSEFHFHVWGLLTASLF